MRSMKCPHCGTAIYFEEKGPSQFYKYSDGDKSRNPDIDGIAVAQGFCPRVSTARVDALSSARSGGPTERLPPLTPIP